MDFSKWLGWEEKCQASIIHFGLASIFFNSLAPGWFEWNFNQAVFKLILVTDGWGIFWETTIRRMSQDLTDDKSTLVQVMAWCRQAASHYRSQFWPRSLTPYGVTRPQWVKETWELNRQEYISNRGITVISKLIMSDIAQLTCYTIINIYWWLSVRLQYLHC